MIYMVTGQEGSMQLHHTEKHSNDIITIHEEPPTMISCTRFKHLKIFGTLRLTIKQFYCFTSIVSSVTCV